MLWLFLYQKLVEQIKKLAETMDSRVMAIIEKEGGYIGH